MVRRIYAQSFPARIFSPETNVDEPHHLFYPKPTIFTMAISHLGSHHSRLKTKTTSFLRAGDWSRRNQTKGRKWMPERVQLKIDCLNVWYAESEIKMQSEYSSFTWITAKNTNNSNKACPKFASLDFQM